MQIERDASFFLAAPESEPLDALGEPPVNSQVGEPPVDIGTTSPLVTSRSPVPKDMSITSSGDICVTPCDADVTRRE